MIRDADHVMRLICLSRTLAPQGLSEAERGLVADIDRVATKLARTTCWSFADAVADLWTLADAGLSPDGAEPALRAGLPANILADALRQRKPNVF